MPIGPYRLEVSKSGFSTYVQTGIVLQVATNPTVDVSLKIGAVNEQVQVEANAALVETQATGVGNVMENQRIVELPLNGRVATDLIQYTGAERFRRASRATAAIPARSSSSIAGGQAFGVAFWLDGSVYNNPWDLANMPLPFPDALQEFKVETSSLTAQNGVHAGGTITGVTRSGTNDFHGDVFEFLRNGDLNARNFFAPTRDTLKRNQFGGTIGGPMVKNKLFFFFGYQDTITRQDPVGESDRHLCSDSRRCSQGDFSACPRISAAVRSRPIRSDSQQYHSGLLFDPASLKLAALLPRCQLPLRQHQFGLVTPSQRESVCRPRRLPDQPEEYAVRALYSHALLPAAVVSRSRRTTFSPPRKAAWTTRTRPGSWATRICSSPTLVNQFRASVDRHRRSSLLSRTTSPPAIWACRSIADTCRTRAVSP